MNFDAFKLTKMTLWREEPKLLKLNKNKDKGFITYIYNPYDSLHVHMDPSSSYCQKALIR